MFGSSTFVYIVFMFFRFWVLHVLLVLVFLVLSLPPDCHFVDISKFISLLLFLFFLLFVLNFKIWSRNLCHTCCLLICVSMFILKLGHRWAPINFCWDRSTYFHTLSGAIRRLTYSDCDHIEDCMTISVCDVEINGGLVSGWHLFHISSFLLYISKGEGTQDWLISRSIGLFTTLNLTLRITCGGHLSDGWSWSFPWEPSPLNR